MNADVMGEPNFEQKVQIYILLLLLLCCTARNTEVT